MSEVLEVTEAIGSDAVVNSHFGLIVDIALGLVILFFALLHARKGLYSSFSGLIAIVVAIMQPGRKWNRLWRKTTIPA